MKVIYTSIPIELCEYALVNRKHNHLMLYVYFKQIASGHLRLDSDNMRVWSTDINKSERWVKSALKWLVKKRWVTINSKQQSIRVVSYSQVIKRLNLESVSAVIFEEEDFSNFKGFCCATVITKYLKIKRYNDRKRWSVSIMGDTRKSHYFYPKGFYTLPISYLAKCLGVSISTANNYKQLAAKANFIVIKRNVKDMIDNNGKKLDVSNYLIYQKSNEVLKGRVRKGDKYLKIVESDLIQSQIMCRRKRLKQ